MIGGDVDLTIERIISSLEKLTAVHHDLLQISLNKTKAITDGLADQLQNVLREEQTKIQQLSQEETKREKLVEQWFLSEGHLKSERTITNMLDLLIDTTKKQRLEETTIELTHAITELRNQEQLNGALIQQSMHFIQTSLNMLKPSIQSMNYDRKQDKNKQKPLHDQSMFDSRA